MPASMDTLLHGAYDLHVHCPPDVVPRAQDGLALARDARQAGLAGMLLKDHTAPTVGRVQALNQITGGLPHLISALVLNPPVGGLNPFAVEAALREGADVVYMPTYSARHQIAVLGPDAFARAYPRPGGGWPGIAVLDDAGALKPEALDILDLIAEYDAVLATGHLSPEEVLALLAEARGRGVRRMMVTHASSKTPGMSVEQQREAVGCGAWIEHCLMGLIQGGDPLVESMRDQIRALGPEHVILSSDLGQAANGPVVAGFSRLLDRLRRAGLEDDEVRMMVVDNPGKLVAGRELERGDRAPTLQPPNHRTT
jgi:hypothetical protein